MPAKISEVQRGIYELFLPLPMRPTIVNVYLIDCGGGQWVLVGTHHHVDHFGASGTIKGLSHARTYLHDLEVERVNRMLNMVAAPAANPEVHAFFTGHGFPIDRYPIEGMRPTWMGTDQYNP